MISTDSIKSSEYFSTLNWSQIATPPFWYEDQPIVTHFMNALSVAIPETERFLVRAVKPYTTLITDVGLLENTKKFLNEENTHSLHHTKFNLDLKRNDYPLAFGLTFTKWGYKFIYTFFSQKTQLAMAVCFEHMTTTLVEYGFDKELMKEDVSPVYDLFIWHAFEELNHRAGAYDVYEFSDGSYLRRILSMMYVTFFFITGVVIIQLRFILSDLFAGRGIRGKHWWYAAKFFFARGGMFWGTLKKYFSIYKFKFIP